MKTFTTGSHLIVKAALDAGVRFYAGYPITPASGIYSLMMEELPKLGGAAEGASDEIGAISYCLGASMRGVKAMTATSAPGFSLMIESLSYAVMTETPLVLVLVQRFGPSTGAATQNAQGDVLFSIYGTSGSFPIPVLSPTSLRDTYGVTLKAVHLSEKLRTPVILLTEKELAQTKESVDIDQALAWRPQGIGDEREPIRVDRTPFTGSDFKTYDFNASHEVPAFSPVGGKAKVRITGSAHDKAGLLKKDDPEVIEVVTHLRDKIMMNRDLVFAREEDFQPGAEDMVISYGYTSRAAREAVLHLRDRGRKISHLTLYSLFPVHEDYMNRALSGYSRIFIPEENLNAQYLTLLRGYLPGKELIPINRIGSLITPQEMVEKIA